MSLASSFNQISPSRRIGIFVAEFQPSGKGQTVDFVNPPTLLAQKLPSGTATAGVRYLISSGSQAGKLFGRGSPLHLMCRAFLKNRPGQDFWAACQSDAGSSTAASQTLTWTGTATAAGTVKIYIGAQVVAVGVVVGDTGPTIAAKAEIAIDAAADVAVTCSTGTDASTHINTVTCKVKGTVGNQVTLAVNAAGPGAGEEMPAGVAVALGGAVLANGATDPTASAWADSLGEVAFDTIVFQSAEATAVDLLKAELVERWNANSAIDGFLITAMAESKADLLAYAAARNYENMSTAGYPEALAWLTPAFETAAAYGGMVARRMAINPAAPVHAQPLLGVYAGGTNFSDTDRDALANGGIAPLVARGGNVYCQFEATTRRLDANGEEDHTFDVLQTPYTLSRIRRRFGYDIQQAYPEHSLVDDDTSFGDGLKMVTCRILRAFVSARYRQYIADGLAEKWDEFVAALIIERDPTNPNRVNGFLPANLANQFRIFAGIISYTV